MLGAVLGFFQKQAMTFWLCVGIAIAVVLLLLGVRNAGRQAERVESLQKTLKAVRTRDEIEADIDGMGDADLKRLRDKWMLRD